MTSSSVDKQFERPDPVLINKIVTHLKSQGIFDQFRRECMADVDTKPAYQNLRQRVEGSVATFLKQNPWRPDMNKNQLRDNLRKYIQSGGYLDVGVDRIVDQVVNPKIYTVFMPKVEEVVMSCLGIVKNKPVFNPHPLPEAKPEPPPFQNKHNLAPRAAFLGPRLPSIPNLSALKPPEPLEDKYQLGEKNAQTGSPEQEGTADRNYVVDEDDDNAEDDEDSPPFEPHTESYRLILGVRTDSSDSISNDSQVVTTIVDDNLEERIDNSDTTIKEENGGKEIKKEDESSSSDEYVPKTPTINMEGSDGTVIEFNSISEYKQYQTKYDDESVENVEEEVVSSQWLDESSNHVKEESAEEESGSVSRKRKLNIDNFDEASSSSIDKESTSDEGKSSAYINFEQKKFKDQTDDEAYLTVSEYNFNETEDSSPEKCKDSERKEKSKSSSDVVKGSWKSHHHGSKDHRSSSQQSTNSKDKPYDREYKGSSSSNSHYSKDKKNHSKKDDKHSSSRDRNKERDRKKSESSTSKHNDRDRSKYDLKDKERNSDKRKAIKTEIDTKEKESAEKDKKETRHEHRDKSRDNDDKEKRKHDNHDKHSNQKQDFDSSHRHDKDKRDGSKSSKHSHNSSKHSHKSSSERHKTDKNHKSRPSDKLTSNDKKSEKQDPRKKSREHCKSGNRDNEGRRSTDRDSNGPSGRSQSSSYSSSTSRSAISRSRNETTAGNGGRTNSNSDNTVSDSIEALHDEDSKFDVISEPGIASPDPEPYEDSSCENCISSGSEFYDSKGDEKDISFESNEENDYCNNVNEPIQINDIKIKGSSQELNNFKVLNFQCNEAQSEQSQSPKKEQFEVGLYNCLDESDNPTSDVLQNVEENICVENNGIEENFSNPACSVHDTSSEKENIEQAFNCQGVSNSKEMSKNIDHKEAKFKKPKIAANIFEVKKIIQARRNLKRMEKKRMKLLLNNNPEICKSEKTASENSIENPSDEMFTGFESVMYQKKETFDCLIKRLSDEIDLTSVSETNPNLITSLIELDPKLDDYIERVLRGKVHRKMRVRLPPICSEYYTFDSEQNAYILTKNRGAPNLDKELVDNNLNNVKSISQNLEQCDTSSNDEYRQSSDTFNGSKSKSRTIADSPSKPSIHNAVQESLKVNKEEIQSPENNLITDTVSAEMAYTHTNINRPITTRPPLEVTTRPPPEVTTRPPPEVTPRPPPEVTPRPPPEVTPRPPPEVTPRPPPEVTTTIPSVCGFVLTFNRTYDEILERRQTSVATSQEVITTPRTVVKITNCDTTEKVVLKTVSPTVKNKPNTKSEPLINGSISKSSFQRKVLPLISRIKKSNNESASSSSTKPVNGFITEDFVSNMKVGRTDNIPARLINDVIGIQATVNIKQDNKGNSLGVEYRDQKSLRQAEQRVQQRYNNSELYKPRLQISRRSRGQLSHVGQAEQRVHQRYNNSELYKPRLQISRRSRGQLSPDGTSSFPVLTTRKRLAVTTEEPPEGLGRKRRR